MGILKYFFSALLLQSTLLLPSTLCFATQDPAFFIAKPHPILTALESSGKVLSPRTQYWMKNWQGVNLEDTSQIQFKEIAGTTSVTLKIAKRDPTNPQNMISLGSFLTSNDSGNPNSELAYFSLAALLGVDEMFRPSLRYDLGPQASSQFKNLLAQTSVYGKQRSMNKKNILAHIKSGEILPGCLKAKKKDGTISLDNLLSSGNWYNESGGLNKNHALIKFIQAQNTQPLAGQKLNLKTGYIGDAYELSREFSILLTLDSVFGQYDRMSGGNINVEKDELGKAHFIGSDNGGSEIIGSTQWTKINLNYFSRYDRNVIQELKRFYDFLSNPQQDYYGYQDPEKLIVDMGMYFGATPKSYITSLKKNLDLLFQKIRNTELRYGNSTYFQ
jgi:hypothetical protein